MSPENVYTMTSRNFFVNEEEEKMKILNFNLYFDLTPLMNFIKAKANTK